MPQIIIQAIFKTKDGITAGPKTFTGTIGKQAAKDLHNTPVANFEIITSNLIELPSDVLKQLSHDQRLLHEYTIGISSGTIDKVYASRTIGPLNHARWLTLALRVMCVYTRTVKPSIKLKNMVSYIVKCYAPLWFSIKQASSLAEAPKILFKLLTYLKDLDLPEYTTIVQRNIKSNSFALLPDNFLYSLCLSNESTIRELGIKAILKIRSENRSFEDEPIKRIPQINFEANHWSELINVSDVSNIREPSSTKEFSNERIQEFIDKEEKPPLLNLPIHSQSVERAVKLVTEASECCFGLENRHKSILTKILSRALRPNFDSKGSYEQKFSDIF